MSRLIVCLFALVCSLNVIFAAATLKSLAEKHKKYFGTAINGDSIRNDGQFIAVVDREFDCVTPENDMKWPDVEPSRGTYTFTKADAIVDHAVKHGMMIRGHNLFDAGSPKWVKDGHFNASELRKIMHGHVQSVLGRYKGKVYAYDVINEAFNDDGSFKNYEDSVYYKTLGKDFIAEAFKWAHEADPHAKLYYNDYTYENINPKSNAIYEFVKGLLKQKVPIHGVGLQSHFVLGEVSKFDPAVIQKNIERFAALGIDVALTEMDVRFKLPVTPEKQEQQAKEYAGVVKACLAVPRCVGITTWGFTDKLSWVPWFNKEEGSALLFDEQFKAKPAYHALIKVLNETRVN